MKINIFWFRRDLRLVDNTGLTHALNSELPVLPVFIFDTNIIDELPADDPRIGFIYETLHSINTELNKTGSSLCVLKGEPRKLWREFFMQILFHFPHVVTDNYKPVYNDIIWRNDEKEFKRWCNGETGYPEKIVAHDFARHRAITAYKSSIIRNPKN